MAAPLCICTSREESSCGSASSSAFGGVRVLDFGHSDRCTGHLAVVLLHISMKKHDVEHLFIFFLAVCISLLRRCLLRSLAYFLIGLFSYCCVLRVLCMFRTTVPYQICAFVNVFSQSVAFHSLDIVFCRTEVVNFNEFQFISSSFHGSCFWGFI